MKTVLHKAHTRGHANHGWLDSYHTFSFAAYHHPERMHFGVLRVLNDDCVAAGRGFGMHPHDNMEIVSIPLEGSLEHRDSMGNVAMINTGEVQVMSAGTGIRHSEYNRDKGKSVRFLQIWIFPNKRNVTPRYDQISIHQMRQKNAFYQILSPRRNDSGVWIHQDAWFCLGEFDARRGECYLLKRPGNGVYVFVIEGSCEIGEHVLMSRDGLGVWDTKQIQIVARENVRVLLMEVPMQV